MYAAPEVAYGPKAIGPGPFVAEEVFALHMRFWIFGISKPLLLDCGAVAARFRSDVLYIAWFRIAPVRYGLTLGGNMDRPIGPWPSGPGPLHCT